MLLENIQLFPEQAHRYGNYASFLKRENRKEEAIQNYRLAIEIRPYGNAKKQLAALIARK